MTKEFNLSEKRGEAWPEGEHYYIESDVKEFIRLLKEDIHRVKDDREVINIIDKLAGGKLI